MSNNNIQHMYENDYNNKTKQKEGKEKSTIQFSAIILLD